jgi:hypothetical protein
MAVILLQKERKGKWKDNSISISVFRRENGSDASHGDETLEFLGVPSLNLALFSWGRVGWARFLGPEIPDSTASSL